MVVAFRQASNSGGAADVSTRATNVPAGVQINDIVVASLCQWQGGAAPTSMVPPTGFTQKDTFTSGDTFAKNTIWWKRLTAADTGTYTWSWSNGTFWTTLQAIAFSGCITTGDPFDGTPTKTSGTFGSITTLTQTLSSAGGGLFWACYNDSTGTHTPPTNFTETADVDCGSCAYRIPGASGSQSAASASISSSSSAGAWLGALLEDGGAAATSLIVPRRPRIGSLVQL